MSLIKYEVFLKVVELGSLTKAAEALGFTQSGISHTISSLEQEFGFPLLVRSRSGVKLTVNGEQVLQPIREILNWNEQLKQQVTDIHGLETGTITIGTFTSVSVHWLPDIIKQFREEYPYIEFKLMEGGYLEIEQWIEAGVVDCGFLSLPTRERFEVIPLKQDRMLAILPLGHPLSKAPICRWPRSPTRTSSFRSPARIMMCSGCWRRPGLSRTSSSRPGTITPLLPWWKRPGHQHPSRAGHPVPV